VEALFKGKIYSQILDASEQYHHEHFLELDFVLKCTTAANNLLKSIENAEGNVDWADVDREWSRGFSALVKAELAGSQADAKKTGQKGKTGQEEEEEAEPAEGAPAEEEEVEEPQSAKKPARRRTELGPEGQTDSDEEPARPPARKAGGKKR
jgi:hypothetical protein